jgi:cytochrome c oxidase assembly protein subunit 15
MSGLHPNHNGRVRLYYQISSLTIVVVFLLIAIGGIVRSSGAGMGCPDWPRCFGQWVPPTHESELPANYQEIYHDRGYADTTFNAVKTWTEYLNRLFGVLTGGFIILHLIFAYRAFKTSNPLVWKLALANLILVLIQGGVGAFVVMTNLHQGIITLHLLLALAIAALLLVARAYSQPLLSGLSTNQALEGRKWVFIATILLLIQMILGTQVRESLDEAAASLPLADKQAWLRALGSIFAIHKVFSVITLAGVVGLAYRLNQLFNAHTLKNYGIFVLLLTGAQMFTGVLLNQFGLPAVPQTLHLVFSSLAFGVLFWLWIVFHRHRKQSA